MKRKRHRPEQIITKLREADAILGTVVAHDKPITARRLTELLNSWGIMVTAKQMSVRLNELANDGRIERVSKGLFEGV